MQGMWNALANGLISRTEIYTFLFFTLRERLQMLSDETLKVGKPGSRPRSASAAD
jgi:hypothetical protein